LTFLDKLSQINPSLDLNSDQTVIQGLKNTELTMTAEELRNTNCQKILQSA